MLPAASAEDATVIVEQELLLMLTEGGEILAFQPPSLLIVLVSVVAQFMLDQLFSSAQCEYSKRCFGYVRFSLFYLAIF